MAVQQVDVVKVSKDFHDDLHRESIQARFHVLKQSETQSSDISIIRSRVCQFVWEAVKIFNARGRGAVTKDRRSDLAAALIASTPQRGPVQKSAGNMEIDIGLRYRVLYTGL